MSSSAFTPSTTTVTNNVPVNVPVVEAWNEEALTWNQDPGLSTSGSYTAPRIKWRRVGSNMEGFYDFRNGGSIAANNVQVSFRLPNNLTIDSTKFIALPASIATVGFARKGSTYEYINYYPTGAGTPSKSIYITGGINAQFAADYIGGGWFSVPIAEWAGSGTTTLATRAVEEYAFNTSTATAANDTTSFGYGSSGAQIQNITASLTRRVRFQTPIQSTDKFCLEVSINRINWQDVSYRFGDNSTSDIVQLTRQLTATYGVGYIVPVNSTDIDVTFGQYAEPASAAYGSAGRAWSAGAGSWYWRVRKISSGASVGFPVSARNIVGDTSGSVVPVGMLGERVTSGVLSSTTVINTTNTDLTSISIGAGVWLVSTRATLSYTSGTGLNDRGNVACWITDGTTVYGQVTPAYAKTMVSGNQNASVGNASFSSIVNTSTPKTLTFRAVRSDIQNTSGATAQTESANNGLELFAIRIA